MDLEKIQTAEFKEAFDEFDKDGSGAISSKELLGVMRAMGQNPTEDELNNLIMEVDLDGNGTIEFPEFLEMMKTKANEVDQGAELREAFRMFDRNKDGFIDRTELKRVANLLGTMLSKEEVEDFMSQADIDGNGQLGKGGFEKILYLFR